MDILQPLAFLLGQALLGGTGFGNVLQFVEQKGVAYVRDFLHQAATALVDKKAARIAKDMVRDGWKVGGTHKGQAIDAAALVHDALYRLTKIFVARGGFVIDQIRDALDHAMGGPLDALVPAGDPTPEWVASVGHAAVDYVFTLIPKLP